MCHKANKPRMLFKSNGDLPAVEIGFDMIENLVAHNELATVGKAARTLQYIFQVLDITNSESDKELVTSIFCKEETNSYGVWSKDGVGLCLFAFASYFNHSCAPVLIRRENGSLLEFVAVDDLPAGTELTTAYLDIDQNLQARKEKLKSMFYFDCVCQRCTYETINNSAFTLPAALTSFTCPDPKCTNFGKPLVKPAENSQKLPYPLSHVCTQCQLEKVHGHIWAKHPELSEILVGLEN